uniref:Uncharacterized protein n=1 Tax=Rhizophora mucronata TaxID=61149 RepID=A0A2P2QRL0_RHIMU
MEVLIQVSVSIFVYLT